MKDYEAALKEYKGSQSVVDEIYGFRFSDDEQAPVHLIKAAAAVLEEDWSQRDDFAEKVIKRAQEQAYSELDNFQKAVFHVLSHYFYEDGVFRYDPQRDPIEYEWDSSKWRHELKSDDQ